MFKTKQMFVHLGEEGCLIGISCIKITECDIHVLLFASFNEKVALWIRIRISVRERGTPRDQNGNPSSLLGVRNQINRRQMPSCKCQCAPPIKIGFLCKDHFRSRIPKTLKCQMPFKVGVETINI